jgi:hypothetical protein
MGQAGITVAVFESHEDAESAVDGGREDVELAEIVLGTANPTALETHGLKQEVTI